MIIGKTASTQGSDNAKYREQTSHGHSWADKIWWGISACTCHVLFLLSRMTEVPAQNLFRAASFEFFETQGLFGSSLLALKTATGSFRILPVQSYLVLLSRLALALSILGDLFPSTKMTGASRARPPSDGVPLIAAPKDPIRPVQYGPSVFAPGQPSNPKPRPTAKMFPLRYHRYRYNTKNISS
jgi:hypothetical protein